MENVTLNWVKIEVIIRCEEYTLSAYQREERCIVGKAWSYVIVWLEKFINEAYQIEKIIKCDR